MQIAREKMKDMVSKAKERAEDYNALSEEREEKSAARTREEKQIAHEFCKARQAAAKMEYHLERAEHRAETLEQRAAAGRLPSPAGVDGAAERQDRVDPAVGVWPLGVADAAPVYGSRGGKPVL
ncbi:hypothetical protein KSP39_PZI006498 [Platanthera zijinensis]|uniref:Uncharacterized protein n=1 Tax=Platanthera zijinensis TaxID=2320716 RepID=A0AAP0BRB6_9ASPA